METEVCGFCVFCWTWWQTYWVIGALPSDLLRSTSKSGLQDLDATLYSSLKTINARRGSSVLLVMYFMKERLIHHNFKPMGYKTICSWFSPSILRDIWLARWVLPYTFGKRSGHLNPKKMILREQKFGPHLAKRSDAGGTSGINCKA